MFKQALPGYVYHPHFHHTVGQPYGYDYPHIRIAKKDDKTSIVPAVSSYSCLLLLFNPLAIGGCIDV